MLDKRLDRALKFQREQNGHEEDVSGKERRAGEYSPEDAASPEALTTREEYLREMKQEEKVGLKEFMLMTLTAWGVLLPVCLGILIIMILIARLLFRV